MRHLALVTALALTLVAGGFSATQIADRFDLSWSTVSLGSEREIVGEDYVLSGSVMIVNPGPELSGGPYVLDGGFWLGILPSHQPIPIPGLVGWGIWLLAGLAGLVLAIRVAVRATAQ